MARKKKATVSETISDLQQAIADGPPKLEYKPVTTVEIIVDGDEYVAVPLAGPAQFVTGNISASHDYKRDPIGPGTMGYDKSLNECSEMLNNWLLVNKEDCLKFYDASQKPEQKDTGYVMRQLLIKPSGVYGGVVTNTEDIIYPAKTNKRIDLDGKQLLMKLKSLKAKKEADEKKALEKTTLEPTETEAEAQPTTQNDQPTK